MNNNTLINDIERVYEGLQHLNIAATKANTAVILDTLQTLEAVYEYLKKKEENHADGDN